MREDDLPACVEIFTEAWNDLHLRHGYEDEVSDDDSWLLQPLGYFLRTDPSGSLIAETEGHPVAFGSSVTRDRFWCLSFLFVRPEAQGQGVGRRLLEELIPRNNDMVCTAEVEGFQSVATALYAQTGMSPCAVRYFLTGPGRTDQEAVQQHRFTRVALSTDDLPDVNHLDAQLLGFTRAEDHRWWLSAMSGHAFRHDGALVGYAYVDDGWIAPALAVDEATVGAMIANLVADTRIPSEMRTSIFGTSGALFRELLGAGWRIEESNYSFIFLSNAGPLPPSYITHAAWLP